MLAPWSETQNGVVGPKDIPQGLTSNGSVTAAVPGTSETKLTCLWNCAFAGAKASRINTKGARTIRRRL